MKLLIIFALVICSSFARFSDPKAILAEMDHGHLGNTFLNAL